MTFDAKIGTRVVDWVLEMDSFASFFNLFLDVLYKVVRVFGAIMLAVLIGLTGFDVFARYTFNNPVLGSNEMIQFLLGGMVFAGFALVTAHRSHIVVSIFEPFFMARAPGLYKGLVSGFNLIGIVAITYIAIRYTDFQFLMQAETDILELRWGDLGIAFAILAAIGILFGIKAVKWPRRMGTYVAPKEAVIAQKTPFPLELVEGDKYAWCACGLSNKQPFCDGSHKGTGITPIVFVAEISGLASICGCKRSDNAPFCNGRHKDL